MSPIAIAAVLLVVVLHAGFFVLESVMWARPMGRKIFGLSVEGAEATKSILLVQSVPAAMAAAAVVYL
jgi:putative membrane protein